MFKERLLICANIIHDPSEDSFYKTVLTATANNELLLVNPDSTDPAQGLSPKIEPFKTKSKIMHSPPKSPKIVSSQETLPASINTNQKSMKVSVDYVFDGPEESVFKELSKIFVDFLEGKLNVLLINWFRRLTFEGYLGLLINQIAIPELEFNISLLPTAENEARNPLVFQKIEDFEKEHLLLKSSKRNFSGILYRFRFAHNKTRKHLILADLFNVIEKFNSSDTVHESLNTVGKGFYRILTEKEEKRPEYSRVFSKVMRSEDFLIIPILNFKDIQPYYTHIAQGMEFIEEMNRLARRFRKNPLFEIFEHNTCKLLQKNEKIRENQAKNEEIAEMKQTIEKLKAELKAKEESIKIITEKSAGQEDKSLLEGILEETVFESSSNPKPNQKLKVQGKENYKELFTKLLRNYASNYSENVGKYTTIIDLNMKIKSHMKNIYMEREKILLMELKKRLNLKIGLKFKL